MIRPEAREILEKTSIGPPSTAQLAALSYLIQKNETGEWTKYDELLAAVRAENAFPNSTEKAAQIQLLKVLKTLSEKLKKYRIREDANPKFKFAELKRVRGLGIKLIELAPAGFAVEIDRQMAVRDNAVSSLSESATGLSKTALQHLELFELERRKRETVFLPIIEALAKSPKLLALSTEEREAFARVAEAFLWEKHLHNIEPPRDSNLPQPLYFRIALREAEVLWGPSWRENALLKELPKVDYELWREQI